MNVLERVDPEHDPGNYWERVVSSIKDGVMIVDTAGYIVSVNPAMELHHGLYARMNLSARSAPSLTAACSIWLAGRGGSTGACF